MNKIRVGSRSVAPSKVVCVGRNYYEHIEELGNTVPEEMVLFTKPNSAIASELSAIHQEPLHYEAELSFLVESNQFVAVGLGLDLTKRQLQSRLKEKGLPWERAKAFDGSALFSEFVPISDIGDRLAFDLSINGDKVQTGNLDLMIYKPDQVLAEVLSFLTLVDGDIIMTGTPKGVGVVRPGDRFEGVVRDADRVLVSHSWIAI